VCGVDALGGLGRTILIRGLIGRLFFLHGAVVIHKYEGAFIIGVGIALGALVPGTQVAFGVVVGQGCLGGALLCSSRVLYG
jgi:hypothetical protein